MEESQEIPHRASKDTECSSLEHASAENSRANSVVLLNGGNIAPSVVPTAVAHDLADGSSDGDVYGHDTNSHRQNASVGVMHETKPDAVTSRPSENLISHDNLTDASSNLAGYDSLNGSAGETANYQPTAVIKNGGTSSYVGVYAEQGYENVVYSPEEEKLWNMVQANCLDFNAWTALIEETEKVAENDVVKIRKVYDAFLGEFPLCYGYWKKYADHEGRLDSVDKVVEVYERAVLAVTYSVDIWLHYTTFAIAAYQDPDITRRLFERGLAYVGTDYQSHHLWDEYIRYEESCQAWNHLAMIYTRILEHPIQQLDRYFNCFKELAASHPLSEIQTPEEAVMLASTMDPAGQGLDGEVRTVSVEQYHKHISAGLTEAEELEKYIAIREEMYRKAKEFDSKVIGFETAIRRPYFHVKPLDYSELENWHSYLDFVESGDDFNKVVKLYERCLIACANYPELWIRYVLCMEASGSMELANNALARATQVFVKKQPEIHLFAARLKEHSGDILGARTEYQILYSEVSPCFLEAIVKHANMEYRLGDKEAALSVYQSAITAEQGKEHSEILPILLVQYSRFLLLVVGDAEKSRDVLAGPLEQMQLSRPLLEAAIHLESIQSVPRRIEYLDALVEKFITPNPDNPNLATMIDREEISSIFLEFLDIFGNAQSIKKADSRHALLFLRQKSVLVSKKRQAEDCLASDKTKSAKAFSEQGHSDMGTFQNGQSQWHSAYGKKAPAWPPTSQPQSQWGAGYTSQAGYAAYGGYGNYGNPELPASAPQGATSFGVYPQSYLPQAYPQQSYAQPTVAATVAPAYPQQPAPAPQPYYY